MNPGVTFESIAGLAEAKRLADLQKRRELKAAGLMSTAARTTVSRKKRREIDYGIEIPFHKPAPTGFHDVSNEREMQKDAAAKHQRDIDFGKINEKNMRTRDKEKIDNLKREENRLKALEKANMQLVVAQVAKNNDPMSFRQRGVLNMPAPGVSDSELERVVKLSEGMLMPPPAAKTGNSATDALIGDYSDRPLPTPMRTPMTNSGVSRGDVIMQEARNQIALSSGQTPLLGDENKELSGGTGFNGSTPMYVSSNDTSDGLSNPTPQINGANETLRRDQLGLNKAEDFSDTASYSSFASSVRSSAKEERRAAKRAKLDLINALSNLPAPQFEYELAAPEVEDDEDEKVAVEGKVEDAADVAARELEIKRLEAEIEFETRSTVVKRTGDAQLPRVKGSVNASAVKGEGDLDDVTKIIRRETLMLMQHDQHTYPVVGLDVGEKKSSKKRKKMNDELPPAPSQKLYKITLDQLEAARSLLSQEAGRAPSEFHDAVIKASEDERKNSVYCGPILGWKSNPSKSHYIDAAKYEHNMLKEEAATLKKKSEKLVKKLSVKLGGYEKKAGEISALIKEKSAELQDMAIDEVVYGGLLAQERWAITNRVEEWKKEIAILSELESEAQREYLELTTTTH